MRQLKRSAIVFAVVALAACASTPGPSTRPPSPRPSSPTGFVPDAALTLCPISVANAPPARNGQVLNYAPFAQPTPGVRVAISPVNGACLSSGFGPRNGKPHNGIDLQIKPTGMVHAAAAGTIREAEYRSDYGYEVVIDHGRGVFTRYAHLRGFEPGLRPGARVSFGAPLGLMGNTGGYSVPIHLHYEVLTGNYDTPKKSFGLVPVDIFSLPRAR